MSEVIVITSGKGGVGKTTTSANVGTDPKLDAVDYSEKLGAIFASNDIKSVTVVRMEVPWTGYPG